MKTHFSRRQFLRTQLGATLAAGLMPGIVSAAARRTPKRTPASERIGVAVIGTGPQGRGVMRGFLTQPDAQVRAVCDVKKDQLDLALQTVHKHYGNSDCRAYHDFREVLALPDIDAVLIATPDHWHVPVAVAAARAGKDMYLEKPMGLSLAEDQILRQEVRRRRLVFQFGTQQRSGAEFQRAVALVRNGRIGQLRRIRVWAPASRPGGSTEPAPVPETLDYEFWLGPAPWSPYTADKCSAENKTWWYIYDYALGFIAGWGVHPLDIAAWGHPELLRGVLTVEGEAMFPKTGACNTAVAWRVEFRAADGVTMEYRGTRNGLEEINAMNDLRAWQERYGPIADHGTVFEGDEGWVLVHRGCLRTHPESLAEEAASLAARLPVRSPNHVRNFLDSVRSRQPTICPVEEAVRADLLCHLSDIATRLRRPLRFDAKRERFLNDAEANARLQLRPVRSPWQWV